MKYLTHKLLKKYRPKLVVVFGNHGTMETRDAIYAVLSRHTYALSVSGSDIYKKLYNEVGGFFGAARALFSEKAFPHMLILIAAPENSAYKRLRNILSFDLSISMPVGDVPSFSEVFAGSKEPAQKIAEEAKEASHSIVCADDETLRGTLNQSGALNHSFGFDNDAEFHITHTEFNFTPNKKTKALLHIKVDWEGNVIPVTLNNCFGKRNIYAAAATLAVARHYDVNPVSAAQELQRYATPVSLMSVGAGIKQTTLFTHYNNVTPFSAREAIETLGKLREEGLTQRVVVIMGDIILKREGEAESLHRTLGELIAHNADLLYSAGNRVVFVGDSAKKHGMAEDNIDKYTSIKKAARTAQNVIEPGDSVLILGSGEVNMEAAWQELRYL